MKTLYSFKYLALLSLLFIANVALAETNTLAPNEIITSNGITLDVFDINTSEETTPSGEKSIVAANSEYIVYQVKDELRGGIDFVWNITEQKSYLLAPLFGTESYESNAINQFNDHIYIKTMNAESKHCSVWQLEGEGAKKLLTDADCADVIAEIEDKLYLANPTQRCDANSALLHSFDFKTSELNSVFLTQDTGLDYSTGTVQHECPRVTQLVSFDGNLYFTTNATEYNWNVWQYNLTSQQMSNNVLLSQSVEGLVQLFTADNLYIVTTQYFSQPRYLLHTLQSDMTLSEARELNAYSHYPFGYNIEPFGILNNHFVYLEEKIYQYAPITLLKLSMDTVNTEFLSQLDIHADGNLIFSNEHLYFHRNFPNDDNNLYSLDNEYNEQVLIDNLIYSDDPSDWQQYSKAYKDGIAYVGVDNELWHYRFETQSSSPIELPVSSIGTTDSSTPHNFVTIQDNMFFIARNDTDNSVSIWQGKSNRKHVEKLINPGNDLPFTFGYHSVVELFPANDYLLIRVGESDYQWFSYSVGENKLVEHPILAGFLAPIKNFDKLSNSLLFKQNEELWQYDFKALKLSKISVNMDIPKLEHSFEYSDRETVYFYFDGKLLAYVADSYYVNGDTTLGRQYVELWYLSLNAPVNVFSSIDKGLNERISLVACKEVLNCISKQQNDLTLVGANWHVQLGVGSEKVEFLSYDAGIVSGDIYNGSYSFSDLTNFYFSAGNKSYWARVGLYSFDNDELNLIKVDAPCSDYKSQQHYIINGEAFYILCLSEYGQQSGLWLRSPDKQQFTLVGEFPLYKTPDIDFKPLNSKVLGNKFYWQQQYFNEDSSFGGELAVLNLYQHGAGVSGSPITELVAGSAYSYTPQTNDEYNLPLSFTITNKPSWANFDENTGQLSGIPESTDVGSYGDIVISVSNGVKTSELTAFSLNVSDVVVPPKVEKTKSSSGSFSVFLLLVILLNMSVRRFSLKRF